jgi:putative membrane protein
MSCAIGSAPWHARPTMTSEPSAAPPPVKHRLHPAGALVMVAGRARELVFLVALAIFGGGETDETAWVYLALMPVVVILAFVRWYRFRYWLEDDHFRVEDGAIIRKQAYIPLDKVQAVDISAGLVQRVLGLVKLQVKTGAAGTQAELSTITRAEAARLRALLRPDGDEAAESATNDDASPGPSSTVHRLTPRELVLAGATSGQLAVVGAMVGWLFSRIQDSVLELAIARLQSYVGGEVLLPTSPYVVAGLIGVGALLAWVLATLWSVAKYARFSVERRGRNIVVCRGLVEQQQIILPAGRVQAVRYTESLVRQPFGYGALYVETVGHAEEKGKASYLHPFVHRDACRALLADLLPQFDVDVSYVRPPRRALPRFLVAPMSILLLLVLAGVLFVTPWMAVGLALAPLIGIAGYVSWRDTGLSLGADVAVVRSRGARRTTAYLRRNTAQLTQTTASVLQRRRKVASVHLTVATGVAGRTFVARDLDATEAWRAMGWALPVPPT